MLLIELSNNHQELQKIIAFEGAYNTLFEIIESEGGNEGGIIVQDCLRLLNQLLKGNSANQNDFRENNFCKKLEPLLRLNHNSDTWLLTDDQLTIMGTAMETISIMCSGNNPNRSKNQQAMISTGLFHSTTYLALSSITSLFLRVKALLTLADLLRGNKTGQSMFSTLNLENLSFQNIQQPQTQTFHHLKVSNNVVERLLRVSFCSRHRTEVQAAVQVFKAYLYGNAEVQTALASTFHPPPTNITNSTPQANNRPEDIHWPEGLAWGTRVFGALFNENFLWGDSISAINHSTTAVSPSPLSSASTSPISLQPLFVSFQWPQNFIASQLVGYILEDNPASKTLLLKIPCQFPDTLLSKLCHHLSLLWQHLTSVGSVSPSAHTRHNNVTASIACVGVLKVLCLWLHHCRPAVDAFLNQPTNLPLLVEVIINPAITTPSTASASSSPSAVNVTHEFDHKSEDELSSSGIIIQSLAALLVGICFINSNGSPHYSMLHSVVNQRLGIEQFLTKLEQIRKQTMFFKAEQGITPWDSQLGILATLESFAQPLHTLPYNLINFFDYEFATFVKENTDRVLKLIKSPISPITQQTSTSGIAMTNSPTIHPNINSVANGNQNASTTTTLETTTILNSYKELIKHQDSELINLRKQVTELQHVNETHRQMKDASEENWRKEKENSIQLSLQVQQLQQQIGTIEKQLHSNQHSSFDELSSLSRGFNDLEQLNAKLVLELKEAQDSKLALQNQNGDLKSQLEGIRKELNLKLNEMLHKDQLIKELEQKLETLQQSHIQLQRDHDELLVELGSKDEIE